MEKEFTDIYKSNHWGNDNEVLYTGSSGPGSEIWYNLEYLKFLPQFILNNKIKSIVDLGCGNCKCLRYLYDTLDVVYLGYDCYEDIINYNLKFNANDKYYFNHLDFCNNKERIFQSDLCIIKDVLMHWKLESIYEFLDYIVSSKKFKFILIINCANQTKDNTDVLQNGNFRPLSANYLPLKKYNCEILGSYNSKEISVIRL